ncbi:MAG: NAD(P)/FAD-dependent oxidoreductase, partial [Planctomycetia bacterium]
MAAPHRVVIIGGGFGGLKAALHLRNSAVEVTLIDRRNFHLFQPLLYQVATGGLSPANIAAPLRSVFRKIKNVRVLMAEVVGFDPDRRTVTLGDESEIGYDTLIAAAGSQYNYFGKPEWEQIAPGLKTIEDATEIRGKVLSAFEQAERCTTCDPAGVAKWLTFIVVGGGPTGVELAGSIAELARHTLKHDFTRIDATKARVVIVEGHDHILQMFHPSLSKKACQALAKIGVEVFTSCRVVDIQP